MSETRPRLHACPACGGRIVRAPGTFDANVGRRTVEVPGEYDRCEQCGDTYFAPGEMNEVLKRASDIIRSEEGLLSSDEIKRIRRRLGVTQPQLEQMIGAGPKTVTRWEKGTVFQNGATDTLLRVLRDVPEAVEYLMRTRGVQRDVVPLVPVARRVSYRYPTVPVAPPTSPSLDLVEQHEAHRVDAQRPVERAENVA